MNNHKIIEISRHLSVTPLKINGFGLPIIKQDKKKSKNKTKKKANRLG